jgi:hypothetical protein
VSFTKRLLLTVLLTFGVSVAAAGAATGATTPTAPPTSTAPPAATSAAAGSTSSTPSATAPQGSQTATTAPTGARDDRGLAGLVLLFGAAGIVAVLGFVLLDRRQTLSQYAKLVAAGAQIQATDVSPQAAPQREAAEAARPTPLTILGPNTVVVGVATDFIAQLGDAQVVATWTAEPSTATGPLGAATSRLSLTAGDPGTFTLTATPLAGGAGAPGTRKVTAVPADRARQVLPFIGAGWGSVVVAIVIAAVTGTLGLAGALTGEAVATILGALAGYVIAKGQTETRSSPSSASGGRSASDAGPVSGG